MQTIKTSKLAAQAFIGLSAVSLLMVSVMAFYNPQDVMDLVAVKLTNNDAFSSIRGVYGGVGLTLFISLIYLLLTDVKKGLAFLTLLWGFYALSRLVTIFAEGSLGAFGKQWLVTETVFFIIAVVLLWKNKDSVLAKPVN
ncbi:DUF4345 domain-containing protein [Adhaeribacter radiodurans]|uniref:DUF4345 domain-containing protein n=1 Tax=Adhaeribacter radiodurans TaxID=2745197 RepID=A0A7L7L935_9BACT|nr:DUF4345 domain-containing protein [Adhaeribacter radiodurans]QMU29327.1 DUF4345 domain-containing protein [Adhaeribacter radiodurans]